MGKSENAQMMNLFDLKDDFEDIFVIYLQIFLISTIQSFIQGAQLYNLFYRTIGNDVSAQIFWDLVVENLL